MPSENNPEIQIFIVGPSGIQNELLASFLEKETGYPCMTTSFEGLGNLKEDEGDLKRLLLIDCAGADNAKQWKSLFKKNMDRSVYDMVVLFNVDPGVGSKVVTDGTAH